MEYKQMPNPVPSEPESEGATMIEYALMAALVAVVCVTAVTFLGGQASVSFSNIGSGFQGNN